MSNKMVLLQELFSGCLEKQMPQRRMQDVANGGGGETQKWNCGEGSDGDRKTWVCCHVWKSVAVL